MFSPRKSLAPPNAFSLVELLAILAVLSVLATLAAPAISIALKGSQLTQAAKLVSDQFELARQTALARNCPVEVRLYRTASPEANNDRYRGIQIFTIASSGTATALGRVCWLPGSIAIDSGSHLSSLIASATTSGAPALLTAPDYPVPGVDLNYQAVTFRYLPNGATNLTPRTDRWFLTLHLSNAGDGLSQPPANFYTLQIDAGNGHIRTFRP